MALSWQTSIIFPFERGLHVSDNSLSAQTLDTHSYCCSSRVSLVAMETAAVTAVAVVSEWHRCRSLLLHDLFYLISWKCKLMKIPLNIVPNPSVQEVDSYLQYSNEHSSPASRMDMAIRALDRYASPWASVMKFDTRTINNERCIHKPQERTEEVLFQTAHWVFLYIRVILYYPELNIICNLCRIEERDTNTCTLLAPCKYEWPVQPETYS